MLVGSHWYKGFSVFSDSIRTRLVDIISSWQRLEFIVYRDHEGRVHITQQFQLEINPMAQNTELSIRTAAKSLQSCLTLCNPTDGSPPGSPIPGILQARTLEWVAISFSNAAAAAAKSLQSCPTLCDPRDGSPPGSPVPGILQAITLEWAAISSSNAWKWKMKVKSLSHVQLVATPWTAAYQAPPSMGFSRQEYWSGVPLPSPI